MLLILIKIFLGGAFCLYLGGETLVKVATRFALSMRISPVVVGLTFVAWSTSMPEAISSLMAQLSGGKGDIAIGNVVGSNIANLALVLGASLFVCPIKVVERVKRHDLPILGAVTVLSVCLLWWGNGYFSRFWAFLFLLLFAAYMYYQLRHSEECESEQEKELQEAVAQEVAEEDLNYFSQTFNLFFAITLLTGGSYFLVNGAIELAELMGLSERVTGLTFVALGSSAPELATSLVAAMRGHSDDFSLGGIVGSNIFNLLFILGLVGAFYPISYSMTLVYWDGLWMLGISALFAYLVWKKKQLGHKEGAYLLLSYVAYLTSLYFC